MSPYGDGFFLAFHDVTRRVRLSRERDQLAAIVEELTDGIVVTDTDHRVVPIIDLDSGEVVGYEALTRFDSGQRPDLVFADAWSVGLGQELEIATLGRPWPPRRRLRAGRLARSQRLAAPARRSRPPARRPLGRPSGRSCSRSPSTR